ncbi:hypothetical protein ACI2OX_03410 [Bacillus sp. N9]
MPTRRLITIFLISSLLLMSMGATSDISWTFIFSMNLMIFLASFIDLFFHREKSIDLSARPTRRNGRGLPYTVEVEVKNRSTHFITYTFVDGLPQSFQRPFLLKERLLNSQRQKRSMKQWHQQEDNTT